MKPSDAALLFLYSSNIRPLYEQDILDLIAYPTGALYQFRYDARYVDPEAKAKWSPAHLRNTGVLVHFSLQQEARYQDPAFIPVRSGTVVDAYTLGDIHVVDFQLGPYVTLKAPSLDSRGRHDLAGRVRSYAKFLEDGGISRPYDFSAGFGADIVTIPDSPLDAESEQIALFQRITEYLQRTSSFKEARFCRCLRLSEATPGTSNDELSIDPAENVFRLTGGKTYKLAILHSQPSDLTGRYGFTASVDGEIITIIGRAGFDVASRYDVVNIILHAVRPSSHEPRDTVLVIEPEAGVSGPCMRLPLRVFPPTGRALGTVAATTLGLALVGLPSLVELPWGLKLAAVALGGLLASSVSVFGWRR